MRCWTRMVATTACIAFFHCASKGAMSPVARQYGSWVDATGKRVRQKLEASTKTQALAIVQEAKAQARKRRILG